MGNTESVPDAFSNTKPDNGSQKEEWAYPTLTKTPWRKFEKNGDWTEQYENKLIEDIQNPAMKGEVENVRLLLIGPIKAGKSSFLNSTACIDKGRIAQVTAAGGEGASMSKKLKVYSPKGKLKNFRLLDTMGIENAGEAGFNVKDLLYVINGNVPPEYKFNPASPILDTDSDFNKTPLDTDKTHCVVFVLDASVAGEDNISAATKAKVASLQDELKSLDIPRIVLLTKVDVLCETVAENICNVYESAKVQKAVTVAENLFHVPKMNIFPVQNYNEDTDLDTSKNILLLLALRQMVNFATDFINEQS
ncbi:interferon-induced protein 44-like [Mercenaria mercenaria]|uniref:interferon-induced protein 44-like n=1 Tax=Mercenaria mercenaria TaxID=6596 RepID=UPI00234FB3F5|nr:interferon-induced protein 44-like [Mercenaria mercenaria]